MKLYTQKLKGSTRNIVVYAKIAKDLMNHNLKEVQFNAAKKLRNFELPSKKLRTTIEKGEFSNTRAS